MSTDWYDNVPKNKLVVVQGRDKIDRGTRIADMEQFDDMFPMTKSYYLGKKELRDPEKAYTRYMKIGLK